MKVLEMIENYKKNFIAQHLEKDYLKYYYNMWCMYG